MKSRNLIYLSSVFCLFAADISATEEKIDNSVQAQSMLAVLYAQSSAEYEANNLQTYAGAKLALEKALANKNWTAAIEQKEDFSEKPPAVILDIDETVLNNIPFQARSIIKGESYPNGWVEWMLEEASTSVAGVYEFLKYADSKGIKIFYVTNRIAIAEEATRNNLKKLGLPFDSDRDVLLMKNENGWTSDKVSRRELIAQDYRILLLIGDQLGDFISLEEATAGMDSRKEIASKYEEMWGKKWFMITNPIYGRWEASIYNNEYPDTESELMQMRLKALKP
ncbi:MAG: 5'-nucleotidase, lipoprotein e(P4) family [Proteobacteria bacterium]|jgi:5'-nucleotidase (lipoprotein e(P4) family)|nr:5'-nucleotidase, lipoprotein e(P4) family [Pseudomonadota bacterium]MDA1083835.1 5'-nucleotidase, lipoprotein e(P4) family [Pseudomonadota bacterium]MDC1242053.1 5'-nucleotidase, lipoprotein e(P4) family [Gammaproteobacteria bacterium]